MSTIAFDKAPTMEQHRAMKDAARKAWEARQAPKLADPMPPIPPEETAPVTFGRAHDVVRWHRDGRLTKARFATKESALQFAYASHWATIWKWVVMDGGSIIERRLVNEPTENGLCP